MTPLNVYSILSHIKYVRHIIEIIYENKIIITAPDPWFPKENRIIS